MVSEPKECTTCIEDIQLDGDRWVLVVMTTTWDYYNDGFSREYIEVNYCPECGKKLND
ncbi:hypothetical protein FP73_gp038 [Bacillus phage Hoody T]|uniref:Uncharacterized protein n=1 Tax=Bacillus phage Hoody T TaxID=1486660 RepID=A0A024B1M1_9CAUD|nr:hypothetical protein FP73_gp038 [Bacillus phage Hoody T]AHZ10350.1 hypothetical protein [Bacillus phage Hoody T]